MNSGKTRSTLMGVVGAYLLYTAYELFRDRGDLNTTMTPLARILFIALFVLAGAALLVYAVRIWKRSGESEENQQPPESRNDLK